jgi:hypothetical protein
MNDEQLEADGHLCDRCNQNIVDNRLALAVVAGRVGNRPDVSFDLCSDCAKAFADWLQGDRVGAVAICPR